MEKYEIDFKQFLEEKFVEENPQVLDDDISDKFDNWLADESIDSLIEYGDKYTKQVLSDDFREASRRV